MRNKQDLRLVFYSKAPNGVVVTEQEYWKLLKTMSQEDFECSFYVYVDADMRKDVEGVIASDSKPIKGFKAS